MFALQQEMSQTPVAVSFKAATFKAAFLLFSISSTFLQINMHYCIKGGVEKIFILKRIRYLFIMKFLCPLCQVFFFLLDTGS